MAQKGPKFGDAQAFVWDQESDQQKQNAVMLAAKLEDKPQGLHWEPTPTADLNKSCADSPRE